MPKKTGLVRIGQIDLFAQIQRKLTSTRAQLKLEAAGEEIRENPDAIERAYLARQLVQCTLPHSNPGDVPAWTRRNGNLLLTIQPAWDARKGVSVGYPYGTLPRLLLFWMTTEAVQTKKRRLELGASLAHFMRELGMNPDGRGKCSDAKRLREQMRRLFQCRISFDAVTVEPHRHGETWLHMEVAPKGELWWDPKEPEQVALWGSWIELGEDFFRAITAAPVPSDMRALRALKQSPLALDLYVWATYKAMAVSTKGKPQFVPWKGLLAQFGADYYDVWNFRKKALAALRKIRKVYSAFEFQPTRGGLIVLPSSRPAVPSRSPEFLTT